MACHSFNIFIDKWITSWKVKGKSMIKLSTTLTTFYIIISHHHAYCNISFCVYHNAKVSLCNALNYIASIHTVICAPTKCLQVHANSLNFVFYHAPHVRIEHWASCISVHALKKKVINKWMVHNPSFVSDVSRWPDGWMCILITNNCALCRPCCWQRMPGCATQIHWIIIMPAHRGDLINWQIDWLQSGHSVHTCISPKSSLTARG